jgi:hypothetical protein
MWKSRMAIPVFDDIMGLTKLNFNSCHFADRLPVTIRFANAIGDILTAARQDAIPPLPFTITSERRPEGRLAPTKPFRDRG